MTEPRFLLFTLFFALSVKACNPSTAQKEPSAGRGSSAVENQAVAETPKREVSNKALGKETLNCEEEITGLSKPVHIPDRLCFDDKRPVDKGERVPNPPPGTRQEDLLYEERDIDYDKLPAEVREVMEIAVGKRYEVEKFRLLVIPGPESEIKLKNAVQIYRYIPTKPVYYDDYWDFKKQGGKLKLVEAGIRDDSK